MSANKIIDEFTDRPVSHQRKSQLRAVRDGNCMTRFKPREKHPAQCDSCFQKKRDRLGIKPWRPGSRGRMPHWAILAECAKGGNVA